MLVRYEPAASATEELQLDTVLSELEKLPDQDRLKYFKEILPLLVEAGPVERAQASKRIAKTLSVSMKDVNLEIRRVTGEGADEKTQADVLTEIAIGNLLFHDDQNEPYTLIEFEDYNRILKIGRNKNFTRYLAGEYYKQTGNSPCNEAIRQAQNVAESQAVFDGKKHRLELRTAEHLGSYWYDLADEKNRAIEITASGWTVINKPPILFRRRNNQAAQVEPIPGQGDIWRLIDFINTGPDDLKLLVVYLVTSLIPNIPHVIPVFHGEKGAAKSTTMKFIRRLIDPANQELLALPKDQNELALHLYGNYMPSYDNLSALSQVQSDLLCGASTGGGISKRTLYSDDDDTVLKFFCCPILNGINVVANATDLLDRCMIFELNRISDDNRREASEVDGEFEKAKPSIFTGILDALSRAMAIYPTVKLATLSRMADFDRWGYAVAEALGIGGNEFIGIYQRNRERVNQAAIDGNAVASAILAYMNGKERVDQLAKSLLDSLSEMAVDLGIDIKNRNWPKEPNMLTRELNKIKSNLLDRGIVCDGYRAGQGWHVTLVNTSKSSTLSTHLHKPSSGAGCGDVDKDVGNVDKKGTTTKSACEACPADNPELFEGEI